MKIITMKQASINTLEEAKNMIQYTSKQQYYLIDKVVTIFLIQSINNLKYRYKNDDNNDNDNNGTWYNQALIQYNQQLYPILYN